jgi:hypothetical protein
MNQKRHRFPCHRWIQRGQRVRSFRGGEATILDVGPSGVRIGADDWACTWSWWAVFQGRGGGLPMVRAWRPAQ